MVWLVPYSGLAYPRSAGVGGGPDGHDVVTMHEVDCFHLRSIHKETRPSRSYPYLRWTNG